MMSDEHPIVLKKIIDTIGNSRKVCIVHDSGICTNSVAVGNLSNNSFIKIHEAAAVRQTQISEGLRKTDICANIPLELKTDLHGVHWECYRNFTNTSALLRSNDVNEDMEDNVRRTTRDSSSSSSSMSAVLFTKDKCIFCGSCRKRKSGCQYEKLSKCMTHDAQKAINYMAHELNDFRLLGLIDGVDLIAKEAMYHKTCYHKYVRSSQSDEHMADASRSETAEAESTLFEQEETFMMCAKEVRTVHNEAFEYLCQYVTDNIITGGTVERMTMLRDRYQMYLKDNAKACCDSNVTTRSLKQRLVTYFGDRIQFINPPNNRGDLVYSSDLNVGDAVGVAFDATASETRILREAALILRRDIVDGYKSSPSMQWPPRPEYLQSGDISPPESLTKFLSVVLSGKGSNWSDRVERISKSVSEDICSASTAAKWKMPKHCLLGMAVHHLTGSAELVTILNRFGHCCNYSFVMEMETAMAETLILQDTILPSNISVKNNKFSHMCWDNFDILEETPSGAGTTHTTHGIIIQELSTAAEDETARAGNSSQVRTKARSLDYCPAVIPDCVINRRVEPSSVTCTREHCVVNQPSSSQLQQSELHQYAWTICRSLFNADYSVPEWGGWLSKMSAVEDVVVSRVGYMTPIFNPITEYSTVQECLIQSLKVSAELHQPFTFVTMDLAAARIAYDIVFNAATDQSDMSKVVIHIGAFHTMCCYMGALGHMMAGSGFEEVLIEAGMCASGSINKVMSGKHFNRAVRVHQRMLEALERMMMTEFCAMENIAVNVQSSSEVRQLASNPSHQTLIQFGATPACQDFVNSYQQFKDDIRHGKLGNTAKFWMIYCDCVWILLRFLRAVKLNDIQQYLASLRQMAALMFSSDRLNYAKYLPLYYVQLASLEQSHPGATALLQDNGLTVARSPVPGCRNAVDITIEQTINRSAKTHGGIIGFSRNTSAYRRWCLTRHTRAAFLEATVDRADMSANVEGFHKSTRQSQIRRSDSEVVKIQAAFQQFRSPLMYREDDDMLYCLSSGRPASTEVCRDLLRYVEVGESTAADFIQTRLVDKTIPFHTPMKRQKLKTFSVMAVTKPAIGRQKTLQIRAERNLLGTIVFLSQKHNIDLEQLFHYPLSPVPWSLATADGALIKNDKSQLLHYLEEKVTAVDSVENVLGEDISVIDGNALFQSIVKPPATVAELAWHIFHARLPKTNTIHFVTDTYCPCSIKDMERQRRGSGICYRIGGGKSKIPSDWKSFLRNSENKSELTNALLAEWSTDRYAKHLRGRKLYYVCARQCFCLSSVDGRVVNITDVLELSSTQEEADTRIILHCLYETQLQHKTSTIRVRSPDTDVFVLLLTYCQHIPNKLYFDTGAGNKRRLIDVHAVADAVGNRLTGLLASFHAFTGCDTTSAFVRKGKRKALKLLESSSLSDKYVGAFEHLGHASVEPNVEQIHKLQQFVCCMYGKAGYSDINKARCDIFRSRYAQKSRQQSIAVQNGIDISLLPPCLTALQKHCARAAYQAYIWRHAHENFPNLPSACGNGWKMEKEGCLVVDWFEGEMMPADLVDILYDNEDDTDKDIQCGWQGTTVEEDDEVDNIIDVVFEDDSEDC